MRAWTSVILGIALVVAACSGTDTSEDSTSTTPATTTTTVAGFDGQAVVDEFAAAFAATVPAGGAIVAIWRGGELYTAASGSQPNGDPIPADGAWRIASVTKPFVATAVLRLVDDGVIDLDAPAASYLASPAIPESVAIRDLLDHSSGITDFYDSAFIAQSFDDLERISNPAELVADAIAVQNVPESPLQMYSNTNYLALGLILEEVTGRSADDALGEIFEVAGLENTYLAGPEPQEPTPVGAYTSAPGTLTAVDTTFPYTSIVTGAWTAGAMVSTAEDLVLFLRALFSGELISSDLLEEMKPDSMGAYGLGIEHFSAFSSDVYGHEGSIPGFATGVGYSPDRDIAVISLVTYDEPSGAYVQLTYDLVAAALAD